MSGNRGFVPRASSIMILLLVLVVVAVPGSRILSNASFATPTSLSAVDESELQAIGNAGSAPAPSTVEPTEVLRGIAPPEVSAQAVYAYDLESGAVLYEKNPDQRRPIASITKTVTALVTVNHADLGEQVLILESDLLDPNSQYTKVGLRAGDTLTVLDLLYGLMLPSGGDAAKALARFVGGKLGGGTDPNAATTKFIDEMNAYVQGLGLKDSYFTDPDGEDDARAFSTAHDVAMIGGELMKSPDLAFIVAQPSQQLASTNGAPYDVLTTNERLGINGVIGIKTGSTEGAGANVLLARQANGGQGTVVMAVLGSSLEYDASGMITVDTRYEDADTIFADMDKRFTWTSLSDTAQVFPGLNDELTVWGMELRDPPVMPIDAEATYQLVLGSPVGTGEQAGSLIVFSGDSEIGSIPVYQSDNGSGIYNLDRMVV